MLKVIIADDEPKVCMLICKLIDWEHLGFKVVGVAHSGTDAYELIKQHNPEVVITDIQMPGFGGIELIKHVLQSEYKIDFIVISGYRYFEYAHDAIKYGVEHYLLKPIDKNELQNTKIKEKIGTRIVLHGASSVPGDQISHLIEDGVCKVNLWTALERDSSPALFTSMVENASKVAGEATVENLKKAELLGPKCEDNEKASLEFFTSEYRQNIIFIEIKKIVNSYLKIWYK